MICAFDDRAKAGASFIEVSIPLALRPVACVWEAQTELNAIAFPCPRLPASPMIAESVSMIAGTGLSS